MSCHLFRNTFEGCIFIKQCLPDWLISGCDQKREVSSGVDSPKGSNACIESFFEDGVSEVEEDFEKDHEMPVVEREVEGVVFASGGMGGDQNIMERFGGVGRI